MKKLFARLVPLTLLIVLILALFPVSVLAAPTMTSITPNTIVNDVVNVITVAGSEFDNTAAVLMDGSALVTNFLNAQTLTAYHRLGPAFPDRSTRTRTTFGLLRVRSSLLAESRLISVPAGNEIFQFPAFASLPYKFRKGYSLRSGFPHSDIAESMLVASSSALFAGCHVLLRL